MHLLLHHRFFSSQEFCQSFEAYPDCDSQKQRYLEVNLNYVSFALHESMLIEMVGNLGNMRGNIHAGLLRRPSRGGEEQVLILLPTEMR